MEKPVDIGALKEIPGFPGYYVDVDKLEVWSYKVRRTTKGRPMTWEKKKFINEHRQFVVCYSIDHKKRTNTLSLSRAIFAAKHGIDYRDERLDRYT